MRSAGRVGAGYGVFFAGLIVAVLVLAGCGTGEARHSKLYRTNWRLPYNAKVSRTSRSLTIRVRAGTCFPDDKRYTNAARRLDHVEAKRVERAVLVTVWMRPEPSAHGGLCGGVGLEFSHTVLLPAPVGRGALIDGGAEQPDRVKLPALDRSVEKSVEEQYGPYAP